LGVELAWGLVPCRGGGGGIGPPGRGKNIRERGPLGGGGIIGLGGNIGILIIGGGGGGPYPAIGGGGGAPSILSCTNESGRSPDLED